MSTKLSLPIDSLRLNLLESHREHCPWKNAAVQCNSKDTPIADMPAWQTLEFMLLGSAKTPHAVAEGAESPARQPATPGRHARGVESVDLGSEVMYPRGSGESEREARDDEDETEGLQNKWRKLKAKLKRTASKKSLRSVKSGKSGREKV